MHELFKRQNHSQVSYSLYYSIFTKQFNLGFGHPATDACATCVKHRLTMKDPHLTEAEKRSKTAMFILHRRRACVFYDMLGRVQPEAVTLCFDMMQNMTLPRTPIGQAYYSRQLYLYLFGALVHHGVNSTQSKNDVHLYVWMEHQNKKDSNMIASAVNDCCRVRLNGTLRQKGNLRLFSDSCFGQNKNMNMIGMLSALRKSAFPDLNIEYAFPIRGHSFLPADRIFGRIEQEIRKHDSILHPKGYFDILRKYGNVYIYGEDWHALNFKELVHSYVKQQRTFKVSEARMLSLTNDQVGFKSTYAGEYCHHAVLKRGKKWTSFKPAPLGMVSTVKKAKKEDVENLLSAIGASGDVMAFYNNALSNTTDSTKDVEDEHSSESEDDSVDHEQ
ncbi:uncharacterized protein LOC119719589 [Patiria miniata]|uniref:DUF7869 domain-containing protein n=1 Tax=Patiria miniata TaxID=46514 RepID=A0A913YZJ0_PATMI|nr:uncharacterized protein LOC119719589 [Patiria miniata]